MKIHMFNKDLLSKYYWFLSFSSVIVTLYLAFFSISEKYKQIIGTVFVIVLIIIYLILLIYANKRKSIRLKINNSDVCIKFGNIFKEDAALKVIAFNEYFDTVVDNNIISASSLNGQFINNCFYEKTDQLDEIISKDLHLNEQQIDVVNSRILGKKIKYKLGTIVPVNDYLLTSFSHFNTENKAYLEMNDYINCLLNFWNEIDRVYAGRTVALPVLGSGITRFKEYENITDQELLELLIGTFKISRIKFTYPAKLEIIVSENKIDKINLSKLKYLEG